MANDFKFGNKSIADILFGNKQVKQIWYGTKLIWEKIQKLLALDNDNKFICIEYKPTVDTTVSSLSVFIDTGTSYGWTCILNECGLCVAVKNESGTSSATIYGLSANLVTVSSMGSPKLLAGRKYYIAFKISQWDQNNTKFAYYQGMSGNYKICQVDGGASIYTSLDLQSIPCVGSIYHLGQYNIDTKIFTPSTFYGSECTADTLFIWKGGYVNNTFQTAKHAMYNKRDMSKFRCLITDGMLNSFEGQANANMKKLAFIYYVAGNTSGNEIGWGATSNYSSGITVNGVNMFTAGNWKIYKTNGNTTKNHITSMTPITEEPQNPEQFAIYYKGQTSSGWLDANGNPITNEMVVAWTGSCWEFASSWNVEFDTVSDYTMETAVEIEGNYISDNFNAVDVSTDKKYYLRINGNEV